MCDVDVPVMAETSIDTYSLHFNQWQVSVLTAISAQRQFSGKDSSSTNG